MYLSCVGCKVFHDQDSKTPSPKLVKLLIKLMTSHKKHTHSTKIRLLACKLLFNICQPEITIFQKAEMSCIYSKDCATTKKFLSDFGTMEGRDLIPQEYVQSIFHRMSEGI